MSKPSSIAALKKENEALKKELADLQYLLVIREEELNEIKTAPGSIPYLQSNIEQQLYAFEHMQQITERLQREVVASEKREKSMEEELIMSIEEEKKMYGKQDQLNSTRLALQDLKVQLEDAMSLYEELNQLQKKFTALQSNLEIEQLENQFLKDELAVFKKIKPETIS